MFMALMMIGRQMYMAEPLVPEHSSFKVEISIEKL
jgi:hypothetical protein